MDDYQIVRRGELEFADVHRVVIQRDVDEIKSRGIGLMLGSSNTGVISTLDISGLRGLYYLGPGIGDISFLEQGKDLVDLSLVIKSGRIQDIGPLPHIRSCTIEGYASRAHGLLSSPDLVDVWVDRPDSEQLGALGAHVRTLQVRFLQNVDLSWISSTHLTSLTIHGTRELSLLDIDRFRELSTLVLTNINTVTHLELLRLLPALKVLWLNGVKNGSDVSSLLDVKWDKLAAWAPHPLTQEVMAELAQRGVEGPRERTSRR